MGQWNTSDRESIVLPKPKSQLGKIVHVADYLASRKDIDISFKDDTDAYDLPEAVLPINKNTNFLCIICFIPFRYI